MNVPDPVGRGRPVCENVADSAVPGEGAPAMPDPDEEDTEECTTTEPDEDTCAGGVGIDVELGMDIGGEGDAYEAHAICSGEEEARRT